MVEDDFDIYEIIKIYLEIEGYQISHAPNSDKVWDIINSEPVDLVLLDLHLPGTNGFEICKKIRESYQIPIIFLSGKSEEKMVKKGIELGANDYMFKPFIPNELVQRIRSYLE